MIGFKSGRYFLVSGKGVQYNGLQLAGPLFVMRRN